MGDVAEVERVGEMTLTKILEDLGCVGDDIDLSNLDTEILGYVVKPGTIVIETMRVDIDEAAK